LEWLNPQSLTALGRGWRKQLCQGKLFVVRYYALFGDTGIIGGRDHRKNCPCVPYWL